MTLYFVTGNANKFKEISAIIPQLEQLTLDLDELQSLNPQEVIEHKLVQAAEQHDGEFIVEDTSLILGCLKGLPGTYIKWFEETIGVDGISDLAQRYDDHSAVARVTIGYRSGKGNTQYFVGEQKGTIVPPRGTLSTFGWNSIFQPEGESLTFAEMTIAQKNRFSMRSIAAHKLADALA